MNFPSAFDAGDAPAGQHLAERDRIVHEIGFAQMHADNAASRQDAAQSAHNGFDFGKFRHSRKTQYSDFET